MVNKIRLVDLISIIPEGEIIYIYETSLGWIRSNKIYENEYLFANVISLENGNGCLNVVIRKEVDKNAEC